ncbi:DUF2637 domain-containing protein [Streptomyces cylindrosporus]|uniref:DUF2637 domain-containing protein n=1 Tax=Streptomyces cylindrosporus TaxID=2927583 RepID=A0ABS9Y1G0_9ACTN|nr:DUF2637 domain-containing protein [Streptomyces cylindrosporus]MCI3271055.1 DUF2637 domain-containing protein [Streptomyces cylindrosporus]
MNTLRARLTLTAGLVIVALTAAAFWLSYAHLHDVASSHGLGNSTARAWAWPATLDLFIVAGEIMMLVAALAKRRDFWAIGLTVAGSVGSIGLNVYGVGAGAQKIEYLVAAVPPTAALLAFGALMRQVHHAIAGEEAQAAPVVNGLSESLADTWSADGPMMILPNHTVNEESSPLDEVLADEQDQEDAPEADEDEDTETVPVFTIATKPTMTEICAAVNDIRAEGTALSGKALARYFGVSDRSGRRYLKDWNDAQTGAA